MLLVYLEDKQSYFPEMAAAVILQTVEIAKAEMFVDQILNEERERPMIHYRLTNKGKPFEEMTMEERGTWARITKNWLANLLEQR